MCAACTAPVGAEAQTLAALVPYFINSAPQDGENFPASATLTGGEQPASRTQQMLAAPLPPPKRGAYVELLCGSDSNTLNKLPCISRTLELF